MNNTPVTIKQKVKFTNYSNQFYYPEKKNGLEELLLFPNAEFKGKGVVNSSVWVYDAFSHQYDPTILGPDIGCGIAGFKVPALDYEEAADQISAHLKETRVLGRGNHFVDLCSSISSSFGKEEPNQSIILIHTDGKSTNNSVPQNIDQAISKVAYAEQFREELGNKLADLLKVNCFCFGNWPHNFIERKDDKIIYRKGSIKVEHGELHLLPEHMMSEILVYTVIKDNMPPLDSMPHGTGRKGPLNEFKVDEAEASKLRAMVYIPKLISDASLKSEHPNCYNSSSEISSNFCRQVISVGSIKIKAYIGKI